MREMPAEGLFVSTDVCADAYNRAQKPIAKGNVRRIARAKVKSQVISKINSIARTKVIFKEEMLLCP